MGKCLTIVKVVGAGSLGICAANYLYSAKLLIPRLLGIADLGSKRSRSQITGMIMRARTIFWGLGSVATYLFYEAFKCSSAAGKHPYLVYSAIAAPLGLLFNYYWVYDSEAKLLDSCDESDFVYKTVSKPEKTQKPAEEKSSLDDSVYSDLGNAPELQTDAKATTEQDVKVQNVKVPRVRLSKDQTKTELQNLKIGYFYSGVIIAVGFLISSIGFSGDKY